MSLQLSGISMRSFGGWRLEVLWLLVPVWGDIACGWARRLECGEVLALFRDLPRYAILHTVGGGYYSGIEGITHF